MLEDKDTAAEVVQSAAEAIGKLEESKGGGPARIQHVTALLVAAGALVTAVGAAYKSCDHSVTENTYATVMADMQKIADEQQKNREDIVALRGYLEGLSRAPLALAAAEVDAGSPPAASASPTPTSRPPVRPPAAPSPPLASPAARDGGLSLAIQAPPVPTVHPAPAPFQAKPWSDVAAGR